MSNESVYSSISRLGIALPNKVLYNNEFSTLWDVSADWIVEHFGVRQRRICVAHEGAIFLASLAASEVLKNIADDVSIDWIIVVSATPENQFPGISSFVKEYLDYDSVRYNFDLVGSGGGFINALCIADNAIKAGQANNILVIGVDTFTRVLDWEDSGSALFGDGAGGVLLSKAKVPSILGVNFKVDKCNIGTLELSNGSTSERIPKIVMDEVKFVAAASSIMQQVATELLQQHGLTVEQINWIIPQQIHKKVLLNFMDGMRVKSKQLISTISNYGYTGASSLLLGIAHAVQHNCFKPEDKILLLEVGAGLTGSAMLLEYSNESFQMLNEI